MGILEVITVVLLVLKLTLYPDWSWFLVASPLLFSFAVYAVIMIMVMCGAGFVTTKNRKERNRRKK